MRTVFKLALPLLAATILCEQQRVFHEDPTAEELCAELLAQPQPAAPEFKQPKSNAWLERCESTAVYYGFDNPPDHTAAAQCAAYHHDPAILVMSYANGEGSPR